MSIERTKLRPGEIAKMYGCSREKVCGWIRRGELRAINVSNGLRAKYLVDKADLEAFEQARQVVPEEKPRPRRRTKEVPKFYPHS